MSLRKATAAAPAAFTIVEMLVSVAVLVMLVALVAQIFNAATATATLSRKHIDADEAARLVFDRMGSDFASMVKRPDVNYIFCKNAGSSATTGSSDAMFFYSEAPGFLDPGANSNMTTTGSASSMALVGYRINSNNSFYQGTPVLERLGENLTWGGAPDVTGTTNPGGPVFLPNPMPNPIPPTSSWFSTLAGNWSHTLGQPPYNSTNDASHFQVLSDSVFRMEFCFMVKSGTYALSGTTVTTSIPGAGTASNNTTGCSNCPTLIPPSVPQPYVTGTGTTLNYFTGSAAPDLAGNVYGFPPDLGGIVVTIAVLDNKSRKLIPGNGLSNLAGSLTDSLPVPGSLVGSTVTSRRGSTTINVYPYSSPNGLPTAADTAQVWQGELLQSGLAQTVGVPQAALQQVRVYERTFYLDAN